MKNLFKINNGTSQIVCRGLEGHQDYAKLSTQIGYDDHGFTLGSNKKPPLWVNITRMKTILIQIFVLIFLFPFIGYSTYCSNVGLYSQADIDNYPQNYGCDSVGTVSIYAGGANIRLDSLYQLVYVESMNIGSNVNDFKGLDQIQYVGGLSLNGSGITSLLNFPNLQFNTSLHITNGNLKDLSGLEHITHLGELRLYQLDSLTSLAGLENLEVLDKLRLSHVPALSTFSLPGLFELTELYIEGSNQLSNLDGLPNISWLHKFDMYNAANSDTFKINSPLYSINVVNVSYSQLNVLELNAIENTLEIYLGYNPNLSTVHIHSIDQFNHEHLTWIITQNPVLTTIDYDIVPDFNILKRASVYSSPALDLNFLGSPKVIGMVEFNNMSISSWPFDSLDYSPHISIYGNEYLTECCRLYRIIREGKVDFYSIDENGNGCRDMMDLYLNCGLPVDVDEDGIEDVGDNCPDQPNRNQDDQDGDGIGDVCDNCPTVANSDQMDSNSNFIGDACETAGYSTKVDVENGDVLVQTMSGLVLTGVNGNCYRVQVMNSGEIRTIPISCP